MKRKKMKKVVKEMCSSRDNKNSCIGCPWGHYSSQGVEVQVKCNLPSDWIVDQIFEYDKGGINR